MDGDVNTEKGERRLGEWVKKPGKGEKANTATVCMTRVGKERVKRRRGEGVIT